MSLDEYLHSLREAVPSWLGQFRPGDAFPREAFFESRVVYYPGSGTDGHAVKVFGSSHSAHCFVYVDYDVTQESLEAALEHPRHAFQGYQCLARLQLHPSDRVPGGWKPHVSMDELPTVGYGFAGVMDKPFGFLEVLERDPGRDDRHGARRLAVLFLGADGIASYDALFCQDHGRSAPFAVLLQDHGFGGNYDRFGRGGLMERIARESGALPAWLLVGENTRAWQGYERVPGVNGDRGGRRHHVRSLYARK